MRWGKLYHFLFKLFQRIKGKTFISMISINIRILYYLNIYRKGIEVHLTDKGDLACQGIHHFVVGINPHTCHNLVRLCSSCQQVLQTLNIFKQRINFFLILEVSWQLRRSDAHPRVSRGSCESRRTLGPWSRGPESRALAECSHWPPSWWTCPAPWIRWCCF